jgi:hypothetical protein
MDLAVTSTVTRDLGDTQADAALERFVEGGAS